MNFCSVLASVALPSTALADGSAECGNPATDWVLVALSPTQGPSVEKKVLQHLRAELAPHRILVCPERSREARSPMATVKVIESGSQQVGIEVQVNDAVTRKIVTRQLDLASLPADAHAMTIALGVAELLRASWAEVNLRSNNETKPVPVSVRHALEAETKREPALASFGLRLAAEEFSGQLRQAGVDATFGLELVGPLQLGARLGARQALINDAPDGRVRAQAWMAGLVTGVRLTPSESTAHLIAVARVDAARVQFLAEPNPAASANSGAGTGVMAGLGIIGTVDVSSMLHLLVEADAGGVIKGVRARDAGNEVVAMNGAWMGVSTGINVSIW